MPKSPKSLRKHAIPPVHWVGTVAWLARVARREERAS